MKINVDEKSYVKPNPIKVGDWVLCKQSKKNKLSTAYYPKPMKVIKRKGTRITASVDGKQITRHANHFKEYHFPKGNSQREEYCDSPEETSGEDFSRHNSGENPRVSSNGSAELPTANNSPIAIGDRHVHAAPQTDVANYAQDTQPTTSGRPARATHPPIRFGFDEHVQSRP